MTETFDFNDLDDFVDGFFNTMLPEKDKDGFIEVLKNHSDADSFAVVAHSGFGMTLRNNLGLWKETNLTKWFKENTGLTHADDMSTILSKALWHCANGTPYDYAPDVERFKKHWVNQGGKS
jgi:hypothetical protein